jgi:heme exporter protein A
MNEPRETTGATALAVRTSGLSRRFGRHWALRDVDLTIDAGTALTLVGSNGAGKTTLLRVLATLLRPSRGDVEVFGHSVRTEGGAIRERTGLLTATGFLYDDLTATENLQFACMMAGFRPEPATLHDSLHRVGLSAAAGVRVRAFSTGMRRRLELARLLSRPLDLVLMDEPFISLDTDGVSLVAGVLEELKAQGCTLIFASHHHVEALQAADVVALMHNGRLEALGPPAEMWPRLGLSGPPDGGKERDA